jgi:hypothetical protein
MKRRLLAAVALALFAGAASAQPSGNDAPRGQGMGHGPGPGGFGLLEFDGNADGKLTKAEFDAAQRARFDKIDADRDGSATREEFQAAREAEMEAHKAAMVKTRFSELDKDKNGQLSQAEFTAGAPGRDGKTGPGGRGGAHHGFGPMAGGPMATMARGPGGPRVDGTLSGPPADGGPQRAGPADENADGKVTFAEFSSRGLEAFATADANKDGTVTIVELQSLQGGRR